MDSSGRVRDLNFPASFVYDETKSRVLAFGIDLTPPGKGGATPRGPRNKQAEKDATFIASAVKEKMIGDHQSTNQMQVYNLSDDSSRDKCTAAGFKKAFNDELAQVGEKGLFFFVFVGSASEVRGVCSLNPMDFDDTKADTYITAEMMIEWIATRDKLPEHVVLVFSCPFADKLTEEMTNRTKYGSVAGRIRICSLGVTSGLENPSGPIYDVLGHSFFAFFFDHFLRNAPKSQEGNFILKEAFTQISECCEALSSLVVTYRNGKLQSNVIESVKAYFSKCGHEEIDRSTDVGRFEFLTKHVASLKKGGVNLHFTVDAFLAWISEFDSGALWILRKNGVLSNSKVLTASFCMMMLSVASFQAAEDKKSLQEPMLFFQTFMRIASTLELVYKYKDKKEAADYPEIPYVQMFRKSVEFYEQVLTDTSIKDKKLKEYLCKVKADIEHIA